MRQMVEDLREIQRNISDLEASRAEAEEQASLQLANSAQEFSRRTRAVVDDKLTFTAALMRAGEVHAASVLLAEVESDVREEEAALIEVVNEVKVAQTARREKMTRLRLARMLVAAMLGSVLLASSAVGMTLASALSPDEQRPAIAPYEGRERGGTRIAGSQSRSTRDVFHRLKVGSGYVLLTAPEFRQLARLTNGQQVDIDELTSLIPLLPPALAARVQEAIDTTTATVAAAIAPVEETAVRLQKETTKAKEKAAEKDDAAPSDPESTPTGDPEPTPTDDPEPSPDDEERDGDGGDLPDPDDVLINDGDEG